MSSKKYASPLRFDVLPSLSLNIFLLLTHFIALILLFILVKDFVWFLISAIVIVVLAINLINKFALLKSADAIVSLVWDANNDWILEQRDGVIFKAELSGESYVNALLTILIFNSQIEVDRPLKFLFSRSNKVLFLKDNINGNDFRRLRVRLKVGRPIEGREL